MDFKWIWLVAINAQHCYCCLQEKYMNRLRLVVKNVIMISDTLYVNHVKNALIMKLMRRLKMLIVKTLNAENINKIILQRIRIVTTKIFFKIKNNRTIKNSKIIYFHQILIKLNKKSNCTKLYDERFLQNNVYLYHIISFCFMTRFKTCSYYYYIYFQ